VPCPGGSGAFGVCAELLSSLSLSFVTGGVGGALA